MSLEDALKFLPHGPEFRFIDKLTELEPGVKGTALYRVRGDEPFLKGHFPGCPLFPGVLLLEAGAQLAGIVAQSDPKILPLANLKLTAMRAVKIFGSVVPGETFQIEATIIGRFGNLIQADAQATLDGKLLFQGSVTLSGDSV